MKRRDLEHLIRAAAAVTDRIMLGTLQVMVSGHGAEGHPTDDPLSRTDPS